MAKRISRVYAKIPSGPRLLLWRRLPALSVPLRSRTRTEAFGIIRRQNVKPNTQILMALHKAASGKLKNVVPSGKTDALFFEQVYAVVRQIPKGRVTSYGAIAAALGTKKSARMVGWAMNSAHVVKPKVPAHRVVNRQGLLTGKMHFATPDTMQQLLEAEGVVVENDQVQDFEKRFWNPLTELGL